jgi:hypothetical protein
MCAAPRAYLVGAMRRAARLHALYHPRPPRAALPSRPRPRLTGGPRSGVPSFLAAFPPCCLPACLPAAERHSQPAAQPADATRAAVHNQRRERPERDAEQHQARPTAATRISTHFEGEDGTKGNKPNPHKNKIYGRRQIEFVKTTEAVPGPDAPVCGTRESRFNLFRELRGLACIA